MSSKSSPEEMRAKAIVNAHARRLDLRTREGKLFLARSIASQKGWLTRHSDMWPKWQEAYDVATDFDQLEYGGSFGCGME